VLLWLTKNPKQVAQKQHPHPAEARKPESRAEKEAFADRVLCKVRLDEWGAQCHIPGKYM
tara:strand:+ start:1948 stop:2127 length:180 start_codon:yes stop_codon:yes gene_type:complete